LTPSESLERPPRSRRVVAYAAIATAIHALAVVVGLSFPHHFGFANKKQNLTFSDIRLYHKFSSPMREGRWPYRDYRVEYPILAIPFFAAPLSAGSALDRYKYAFVIEMLLVDAALTILVARRVEASIGIEHVPSRLAWYSAYFIALCPLVVLRFDLAATLFAFASACWLASGRMALGGVAAGIGLLVKLVPALILVPFLAIRGDWRPRAKALLAFLATVGVGMAAWWSLARDGLIQTFRYHGERGLELETVAATAYMVAHKLAGVRVLAYFDHGGFNLGGPGAGDAARLTTIVQAALLVLVAARARQAGPAGAMRHAAAALLAFLVAGKVFSPQFMIWLIPFLAALESPKGTTARVVFLACCFLTTAIFPNRFGALTEFRTEPVLLLLARNLGMIWLFATLIARDKAPISNPAG
jgi:hypothetical protein